MLRPRITPCLLVKNGGLVKTINFDNPKYVGDPINAVKIFNEKEVDEIIVVDIDASVHQNEPDYVLIKESRAPSDGWGEYFKAHLGCLQAGTTPCP